MSDYYGVPISKTVAKRKMDPPWMEQVNLNRYFFIFFCGSLMLIKVSHSRMQRKISLLDSYPSFDPTKLSCMG